MWTEGEQIEILGKLGYVVLKGNSFDDMAKSGYRVMVTGNGDYYYVFVDGKTFSVKDLFKKELTKRLFNFDSK